MASELLGQGGDALSEDSVGDVFAFDELEGDDLDAELGEDIVLDEGEDAA